MSVSSTPTPGLDAQPLDYLSPTETPSETSPRREGGSSGFWKLGGLDPKIVRVLTVLGFAVPALAYLAYIKHYQVNAVWEDQWDEVPIIRQSFVHFPDWSSLWSMHNNNRMLFPNLIVVGLAHTVRYNLDIENFIGAFMLFGATALLIWTHKRRSPRTPLLFYCPVVFLTLTISQYQNTLWGFQMAWYLILLALAASMFWLDRPRLTWPIFVVAAAAAIIGSYSSVQGLLIWPVGLVLLYHRRRSLWAVGGWIAVAAMTTAFYLRGSHYNNQVNDQFILHNPLLAVKVYMFALGDIVGEQMNFGAPGNPAVMLFGIFIFVLAIFVVIRWGIRRDDHGPAPIGVALIVFGLLFDALVTDGRVIFGLWASTASRYVTNDVLVLVGIYLAVLGRTPSPAIASASLDGTAAESPWRRGIARAFRRIDRIPRSAITRTFRWIDRIPRRAITRVALLAIAIQVVFSIQLGIQDTREWHRFFEADVLVSHNINKESPGTVQGVLYFVRSDNWLKQQAQFLREHHFAQFG